MKTILAVLVSCITLSIYAQSFNQRTVDSKSGEEILIGYCNKQGLKQAPFNNWFDTEYQSYNPNMDILTNAKKYLNEDLKIIIIFGTWCSDSQEQLPRFFKVMDYIGYSPNMIELIAVDKSKKAGKIDISLYSIEKVPTFIFMKNGKEIGRIVETPKNSLEKDIMSILKNQ